jgi:adenosylmethionine-8-amino-7-oxononanoate aminotransferase
MLAPFPHVPWDDADAAVKVIEAEDPATIAAFVFEPITGAAGACLEADDGYWRTIAEACRHHGILLVADEVMTGFGRTGTRWGHDHLPLRPDIVYGGKGLGGGYVPSGMVAATAEVVEPLRGAGFMFFTFTGTDAVCAASRAVLQILRRERLVERAAAMGDVLAERLTDALGDHPHVLPIRGRGLFRGLELVADRATGQPFPRSRGVAAAVVRECLANDLWVYPAGSGPVQDAVMLGPPLVIEEAEVEVLVERLVAAIEATTG